MAAATYGTYGSASVVFASDDLTAAHLTIANDAMDAVKAGQGYPPGAGESGGAQAVALMTIGDRVLLERVQLLATKTRCTCGAETHAARARAGAREPDRG